MNFFAFVLLAPLILCGCLCRFQFKFKLTQIVVISFPLWILPLSGVMTPTADTTILGYMWSPLSILKILSLLNDTMFISSELELTLPQFFDFIQMITFFAILSISQVQEPIVVVCVCFMLIHMFPFLAICIQIGDALPSSFIICCILSVVTATAAVFSVLIAGIDLTNEYLPFIISSSFVFALIACSILHKHMIPTESNASGYSKQKDDIPAAKATDKNGNPITTSTGRQLEVHFEIGSIEKCASGSKRSLDNELGYEHSEEKYEEEEEEEEEHKIEDLQLEEERV